MGNSRSRTVTTDRCVSQVRQFRNEISDQDKRLYNFARIKIAKEDLSDAEITIEFQDHRPVVISATKNPSASVYIGYNHRGSPELVWKKRGVWRSVKRFFISCFKTFTEVLLDTLKMLVPAIAAAIAGVTVLAIAL